MLVVDFEMGPYQARDRLRDLGATDDELECLLYVAPWTPATHVELAAIVDEWNPALVVIDAAAGAYGLHGLDDNKRADVESFAAFVLEPFRQRDVATILLDHVTKNSETRGKFAIGSERKVGGADVHLGFEAVVPFGRGRNGLVKITTHKDRHGHLPRPRAAELELRSDPFTHAVTWNFQAPEAVADTDTPDGFRPTVLMDRVLEFLAQQDEPVSRRYIAENVTGKREWIFLGIQHLVAEGRITPTDGKKLTLKRNRFPAVPNGSQEPEGTGSLPLQGGTVPGTVFAQDRFPCAEQHPTPPG